MYSRRFLILSIGRTATKWLAQRLRVPHEPDKMPDSAVSPRHLFLLATGQWKLPIPKKDCGVLIREPRSQVLSILNRDAHLKGGQAKMFKDHLRSYLDVLEDLVWHGARLIRYEEVTTSRAALREVAEWFGVAEPDMSDFERKLHTFPKAIDELPEWAVGCANAMDRAYVRWGSERWLKQGT